MPFKLLVKKTDEPALQPDAYVFQQERITIGRDGSNELPLTDYKRVVSKQHAEIVQQGSTFFLSDLGSKNFTYLNGGRIESGRPYELHPGDLIRIGEYELAFEVISAAPEPVGTPASDYDRTVFDVSFVNPFEEDAKLLATALRSIGKHYDKEAPNRRDDALKEALRAEVDGSQHAAYALVARLIGGGAPPPFEAPAPAPAPVAPAFTPPAPPSYQAPTAPPSYQVPPAPPSYQAPPAPAARGPASPADEPRLLRLVDTLLRSVARLISAPWNFRHEFIGQTIMQSEETAFLYEGNAEVMKRRLLDASASPEEAETRLRLLEEAIEDVALHQVAMLDGYKAGVQEGAQRWLDQISPEAFEEAVAKEKPLYRFFPPLAKAEALERLKHHLQELRAEDWSAGERRTYRPAFVKAYLARMTSRRQASSTGHY